MPKVKARPGNFLPRRPLRDMPVASFFFPLLILLILLIPAKGSLADGSPGTMPQAPPMPVVEDDDEPRRDFRMGNVDDNMKMGSDEDGNMIMEVRPRPPQTPQVPDMGPMYIYPQVYPNGATNPVNPVNPAQPGGPASPTMPMAPAAPMVQ